MATRQMSILTTRGDHSVGNLSSLNVKTIAHGAIVTTADVDNFTLCETSFNAEGERTCKQLSVATKKGYLIASPETLYMGEEKVDFYNAIGDRARIVVLESGYTRFETSAFALNTGITQIVAGQFAHFDVTAKKFLIHDGTHANYASAVNKFLVVNSEADLEYTSGKAMVMLETI